MEDRIQQPRKLHEIIHKFYLSFEGYWLIKGFTARHRIRIINASKTSMIDAFERMSLKEFAEDMPQK
jgi:hypothetical protein